MRMILLFFVALYTCVPSISINNEFNFCLLFPPTRSAAINENHIKKNINSSIPTCFGYLREPSQNNTKLSFPSGFILGAHYRETKNYFQVSGALDVKKLFLDKLDAGASFDDKEFPQFECVGSESFLSFVQVTERYMFSVFHSPLYIAK